VNKENNIAKQAKNQTIYQINYEKLRSKLPSNLSETASKYGVIKRRRKIQEAPELLVMVMLYATAGLSLRLLSAIASLLGIASVSDEAWRKKLQRCDAWLSHILNDVLPSSRLSKEETVVARNLQIEIVDATNIMQEGKAGDTVRVHTRYSLPGGNIAEAIVADKHSAESIKHFTIEQGHLYIADKVYGKGDNFAHVISHNAHALFRITPSHVSLSMDLRGKEKLDMAARLTETKQDVLDIPCFIRTTSGNRVPVRVIASRLPDGKRAKATKRVKRKASKEQTKNIRTSTFTYAGWVIVITSLSSDYSPHDILKLYNLRWQIELLFKRIKQFFKLKRLKAASMKNSRVIVLTLLILWAISERDLYAFERVLIAKKEDMTRYSTWVCAGFFFHMFKASIMTLVASCYCSAMQYTDNIFFRLQNHRDSRANQDAYAKFFY